MAQRSINGFGMKDGKHIDVVGTIRYYKNDKLHREDGPALEWDFGDKEWWLNGVYHREDGPAVEGINNHREWWIHGKRHRKDGAAIIWDNNVKDYYYHGHYTRSKNQFYDEKWRKEVLFDIL